MTLEKRLQKKISQAPELQKLEQLSADIARLEARQDRLEQIVEDLSYVANIEHKISEIQRRLNSVEYELGKD